MQQPVTDIEPEPTRRLVVVRHARAEAFAETDRNRQLTPSGVADAHALAGWLLTQSVDPDRALVSTAIRTRQTWSALTEIAPWGVVPEFDDCVYAADATTLLDELAATDPDVKTVIVLGHNPTMAYLAQILADGDGPPEVELEMAAGFPTCSAAILGIDDEWTDIGPGGGRLAAFHVGRAHS